MLKVNEDKTELFVFQWKLERFKDSVQLRRLSLTSKNLGVILVFKPDLQQSDKINDKFCSLPPQEHHDEQRFQVKTWPREEPVHAFISSRVDYFNSLSRGSMYVSNQTASTHPECCCGSQIPSLPSLSEVMYINILLFTDKAVQVSWFWAIDCSKDVEAAFSQHAAPGVIECLEKVFNWLSALVLQLHVNAFVIVFWWLCCFCVFFPHSYLF